MKEQKIAATLSGVSGEYFVAAELSRQGYIASVTLRNTRGVDILASNADALRSVGIQVKTSQAGRKGWLLNKKAEDYHAKNLFYVFVELKEGLPDFHVVPSRVVAEQARTGHADWLTTPGRGGRPHRDSPMRMFRDPKDRYLGRWDLLKLG